MIALAGAGLVLLSTAKYGAGLSPDSTAYLDVARSLISGKGFVFHTGNPLVWYAPFYSMLLALIGFATRLDPAAFAHVVNAVLFAFVIYLSARLLQTGSRLATVYSLLSVCAVLLSAPFSLVYAMAWSECLFIPLVLLYLVFAQHYWDRGGMLPLAVMILSTALACLTRYIGIALVPAGAATIMLASGVNFRARLARAFAFATLSLVPLGFWVARNYRLSGTLVGDRFPSGFTFGHSVILCVQKMLSWYAIPGLVSKFVVLAWMVVLATTVLSSKTARGRLTSGLRAIISDHTPIVLFLVAFLVATLMAARRDATIDSRMLSPVYVALTLVLLKLAYQLLCPTQPPTTAFASTGPVVLLALWLCFPLTRIAQSTKGRLRDGAGDYSKRIWRESETVAYAKQMLSTNNVHVYSNDPGVLWELARLNATLAPMKTVYSSRKLANKLGDLVGRWPPEGEAYLVWFENAGRPYLFSVAELEEIANIEEIAHVSDGSIYRVLARQATVPDSNQLRRLPSLPRLESPQDESK
jgi:hypothetical protein